MNENNGERYARIINLPRPVSKNHEPMSAHDRAAQFAPFAALTGFDDVVGEKARLTESFVEPDEDTAFEINRTINQIIEQTEDRPEVSAEYFVPDSRKSGGKYVTKVGRVRQVDFYDRTLLFDDDTRVPIDFLYRLKLK